MTAAKVLEQASTTEAFSNGSVKVELHVNETIAGINYNRKVGRWYENPALNLINDYPANAYDIRVEKHPGGRWILFPRLIEKEVFT